LAARAPFRIEHDDNRVWQICARDLRTPAKREADAWEQERERIVDDSTEFQRALNAPWSYEVFANFGWRLTDRAGARRESSRMGM
jgi:hypothetical protein